MNMNLFYRILANIYDLLDVIYFRNYERSPRKAVFDRINENEQVLDLCTNIESIVQIIEKIDNKLLVLPDF